MFVRGANHERDIFLGVRVHHAVWRKLNLPVAHQPEVAKTFAGSMNHARLFVVNDLSLAEPGPDGGEECLVVFLLRQGDVLEGHRLFPADFVDAQLALEVRPQLRLG